MRQKRKFTTEEENTIKALYEEGVGIKTIAKGLHCHPDLVSGFVKGKYGPNSLHAGRKKVPNPNPKHDIHISPEMAIAIALDEGKQDDVIKPADIYSDIPSDLKAASYDEDGELMHELVTTMKEKRSMYPYFVSHMVEEKDYFERNGIIGHTHLDILIPGMKVVIVNVKDKEEQARWKKKTHVDGFCLTEYLNRNGIYTIIHNYNGVDGILKELEELALWNATHRGGNPEPYQKRKSPENDATAEKVPVRKATVRRSTNAAKDAVRPPVGDEWKPWMIPTEVYIPKDMKDIGWKEYAKDYERRLRICNERNATLKG